MITRRTRSKDGTRLAWHEVGEGPQTAVLIQGLGMPGRMWSDLAEKLAKNGIRVLLPDNRGVGLSSTPIPPYTLESMADDVIAVLDAANIPNTIVAGISMGGMIAQHVVLRHPERAQGLMLVATTCGLPHGKFLEPQALALLLKTTLFAATAREDDFQRLLLAEVNFHRFPELLERWQAVLGQTPTSRKAFLGHLTAAVRHNTGSRLPSIKVPTEVVAGRADYLMPPRNAEILADRIPDARLTLVKDAGHVLPFENPDALIEAFSSLGNRIA